MAKFGICRVDRIKGVADGRLAAGVELENGTFAVQNEKNGKLALATAVTDKAVLVASVAHQQDSRDESDFINKVGGVNPRTYTLQKGDIFTVTAIAFTGGTTPRANFGAIQVGDFGHVYAGKLAFFAAKVEDAGVTVEVIGKTKLNGQDAVQVKVV